MIGLFRLFKTDSLMSLNDNPCNTFVWINSSFDVRATSVGYSSVIVCPAFFAQA